MRIKIAVTILDLMIVGKMTNKKLKTGSEK